MWTLEKSPNNAAVLLAVPPELRLAVMNEKYPFKVLSVVSYNALILLTDTNDLTSA